MNRIKTVSLAAVLASALAAFAAPAAASLYTTDYGSLVTAGSGNPSDCDDCYSAPVAFAGALPQTINFFGAVYNNLFVGSNGYVTFGAGANSYSQSPLNTQTVGKMVAGLFTDLDSRSDGTSNVYANTSTNGQIVVTWVGMGHYATNYSVRSTFQLVIRSDQFTVAAGEGQIGFFYGDITDGSLVSAGFGDGLSAVNPGEVAFASGVPGSTLSNSAARFYNLSAGTPVDVPPVPTNGVPEPASIVLLGLGAIGAALARRRRAA